MKQMPTVLLITLVAIASAHAATNLVRVFILAGQSNIEKHGPESETTYYGDMAVYLQKPNPFVEPNNKLMKEWAKEGK